MFFFVFFQQPEWKKCHQATGRKSALRWNGPDVWLNFWGNTRLLLSVKFDFWPGLIEYILGKKKRKYTNASLSTVLISNGRSVLLAPLINAITKSKVVEKSTSWDQTHWFQTRKWSSSLWKSEERSTNCRSFNCSLSLHSGTCLFFSVKGC